MVILMADKKEKKVIKTEVKKEDAKPKVAKEVKKEVKATSKADKKVVESKDKSNPRKAEKKDLTPKAEPKEGQTKPVPKETGKDLTTTTKPATKSSKKKKKAKKDVLLVKAKRKTAVATAKIEGGNGRITINKKPIAVIDNKQLFLLMSEPVKLADNYKPGLSSGVNISVVVNGGGFMSQTIAARGCIAKGLVNYYKDDKLRAVYMKYDKALLVDDARRKEAKKQLGLGARAKKQHSKR